MDPIPLGTADLCPIIPEALRRKVFNVILFALEESPYSKEINLEQWRARMSTHLHRLFDKGVVDLGFIDEGLRRRTRMTDEERFVLFARIYAALHAFDVPVRAAPSPLTIEAQRRLLMRPQPGLAKPARSFKSERRMQLGDVLVHHGVISEEQLRSALGAQKVLGGRLGTQLVRLGILTEEVLADFLAVQLGYPAIDPTELSLLGEETLDVIPQHLIQRHSLIPLSVHGKTVRVAMVDPSDVAAIDAVAHATGLRVLPVVAPEAAVERAKARYYGANAEAAIATESEFESGDFILGEELILVLEPDAIAG